MSVLVVGRRCIDIGVRELEELMGALRSAVCLR